MENKKLLELKLRENEEDIRELPEADYRQLNFRLMTDFWQYLNALNITLVHLQLVTMEIAKKQGINIEKVLNDLGSNNGSDNTNT
jgi:hypothetical protein